MKFNQLVNRKSTLKRQFDANRDSGLKAFALENLNYPINNDPVNRKFLKSRTGKNTDGKKLSSLSSGKNKPTFCYNQLMQFNRKKSAKERDSKVLITTTPLEQQPFNIG